MFALGEGAACRAPLTQDPRRSFIRSFHEKPPSAIVTVVILSEGDFVCAAT